MVLKRDPNIPKYDHVNWILHSGYFKQTCREIESQELFLSKSMNDWIGESVKTIHVGGQMQKGLMTEHGQYHR